MADQSAANRREFFQHFRLRRSRPDDRGEVHHRVVDRFPSDAPEVIRRQIVDWRPDVAPSWEDGVLLVFTQAGAMMRWELSPPEVAFLRPIDGQRSIGSLHDAAAVEPDSNDGLTRRIALLTELLDAGVLRLVPEDRAANQTQAGP